MRLRLILTLAAAYGLIGIASLRTAVPPGYTAPMFPAAGVALMGLLLWRRVCWPGVLLGSFAVQLAAGWQAGVQGAGWVGAVVVPLASTLQAVTGEYLVRRWVGWPDRLDTPRAIVRLFLGAVPVSCLVCAGISVPVLSLFGVIPAADAVFNGWCWWLGDTLGALIALPLMLAWFGRPRREWRARRWAISVPLLVFVVALAVLSVLIRRWEALRVQSQFNRDAGQVEQTVRKRLDAQLDILLALQQIQAISPAADAGAWRAMTQPWRSRFPGTQNLGWSPRVDGPQRAGFERDALGSPIIARDEQGRLTVSPPRPVYYPIRFIEPYSDNRKARGLDIQSLPVLAHAVTLAVNSGMPVASGSIRLVQESGQQRSIVVYQAVMAEGTTLPLGVVSSVFRMDDILNSSLPRAARQDVDICLTDMDAPAGAHRLSGEAGCEQPGWLRRHPSVLARVDFAGRHWSLRLRANDDYLAGMRSWLEWATVVVGLAMSGLFGGFLLLLTGYTRRVETEVADRTTALAHANLQLRDQLDATRRAELRVEFMALHDSLTGLPNRGRWLMAARQALLDAGQEERRVAVLFLDIDEFKTVNDSLGHPVGDLLLVEIARRLVVPLPELAMLARHGGDEFVALLPFDDIGQVHSVARRLLEVFLAPVVVGQHELHTTVSIGVALYPEHGGDPDTLLRHADLAMYAAKAAGRDNVCVYAPEMNANALERLTLEQDLRRALADDSRQLVLHYQPQVDAISGRCVGCEALVRWQHPQRGLLMPGEFIGLAERSGLIVPLGLWVLAEACRQYGRWAEAGQVLPISVNLSPVQLGRRDLPGYVEALFAAHAIPPGAIELELTESTLMDDSAENLDRFHALMAHGCRFALDDFGTGYSSLSRLTRYPISRLKVDQSFVQILPGTLEDAAIVKATLSLARDLWLEVVAEGVETEQQRDSLLALGCHIMQGYWFGRPMPAHEFATFARRGVPFGLGAAQLE